LVQCHNDQFVDLCALQENKGFLTRKIGQKVSQMTPIRLEQGAILDQAILIGSFWLVFFIEFFYYRFYSSTIF
jgi:hypothetical protein